MYEPNQGDATMRRLQHEKNVWRGIAIGLATTLVLILVLAGGFTFFMLSRSRAQAMRAEDAMRQAEEQREQAQRARMLADEAARRGAKK
jgi:hypothetical protein